VKRRRRIDGLRRSGALMNPLAGSGMGAKQLRRRARDPAPHDASQFIVAAAQPLGLAFGELTASTPCRLTKSSAASQILRSLVIIIIVNPASRISSTETARSSRAATAPPISCYLQLTVYCIPA